MQTPPHPRALQCWGENEDESVLECRQVLDVTHDVKTFTFASPDRHLFHFEPGQFVTLRLDIDGRDVMRSYTVSSPPTRPHLLSITVKRKAGGLVSPWLHDTVRPGSLVRVQAPLGAFSITHHPARRYLFLSAGSGITPLMSMTRTLTDMASDADVLFVHSGRTPADLIFRDELDALAVAHPTMRVAYACSSRPDDGQDATAGAAGSATGTWGRLDRDVLRQVAPDAADREVFVCGPAAYREAVRDMLTEAGVDPGHVHEETFSFEDLGRSASGSTSGGGADAGAGADGVADDVAAAGGAGQTYAVEFTRSGRTIDCAPDETILAAAFRAGLTPPSSCTEGICGTCKTVLVSGEVDMQHQGGIRPREIAAGKVLICCSTPLSNVSVEA